MLKTPHAGTNSWRSDVLSRGRRTGLCTLSKVSKTWQFCSISKSDGRRGTFQGDLQRCIFRGRRHTRDMFIRAVRRSGRWFPERGCILEHQIFRFAEILRDRCSTSYDLAPLFRRRRSTLDRWSAKIAKRIGIRGRQLCTQLSIFEGGLAQLLRFWCCQLQNMRKCRRITSFLTLSSSKIDFLAEALRVLMLSSSKTEEVSQNSFVCKLADRQIDKDSSNCNYNNKYHYTTLHYTTTTTTTSTNILRYITQH